ncbi:MAG: formylglycine-generating enzyme family protein [Acidobacteriota bacterium]
MKDIVDTTALSRTGSWVLSVALATAAAILLVTPTSAFQAGATKAGKAGGQKGAVKATQKAAPVAAADPKPGDVKVNRIDGQRYIWIPPGKFRSGCSVGDPDCFEDEFPTREITLTKGFWLGETEVTQAAYDKLVDYDPSLFHGPNLPVEQVTGDEAEDFCGRIGGRLPSEAEWEFAARGGTTGARYGKLDEIAWYWKNSSENFSTHPVKLKKPNAFGLYDMLGNVVEWTHTWYTVQHSQEDINPTGPSTAEYKSLRGGGWWDDPELVRVSYRRHFLPEDYDYNIGFRCVSQ